ncbi:MAG: HAD family hydrolase [Dorea sp.]
MKACIFDLDGTLTDTLESLTFSVRSSLKEMNLPEITKEQCRSFVGNGARRLMEDTLRAVGDEKLERIEEAMEIYGRIFDENCTYHVTPYEGVMELLKALKQRGIKTAVLSNKPHRQTVKVVEEVLGNDLIDWAQGQQEQIARKPSADGVYAVMEKLGVTKEECLYIGDSEVDAETGKNAEVKTICVTWGFRTREELECAGADDLIDKAEEVLKYI